MFRTRWCSRGALQLKWWGGTVGQHPATGSLGTSHSNAPTHGFFVSAACLPAYHT